MSAITRMSSNAPWEPIAAYSRLVRAGDFVAVSGTTAFDERGLIVGAGQMYVQARQALSNIQAALERAGLSMSDVVRTRIFVTDISRFAEAARAHREVFADARPACTMVEVRRLVGSDMMIEIEADAYAGASSASAKAQPAPKATAAAVKKSAPKKKTAGKKVAKAGPAKKSSRKPARRKK